MASSRVEQRPGGRDAARELINLLDDDNNGDEPQAKRFKNAKIPPLPPLTRSTVKLSSIYRYVYGLDREGNAVPSMLQLANELKNEPVKDLDIPVFISDEQLANEYENTLNYFFEDWMEDRRWTNGPPRFRFLRDVRSQFPNLEALHQSLWFRPDYREAHKSLNIFLDTEQNEKSDYQNEELWKFLWENKVYHFSMERLWLGFSLTFTNNAERGASTEHTISIVDLREGFKKLTDERKLNILTGRSDAIDTSELFQLAAFGEGRYG